MLSHAHSTIFIHIPKSAGQSIELVFLRLNGLAWKERAQLLLMRNDDQSKGPKRLAHLRACDYVAFGHVCQQQFDRYFKFTFVRNPWDRLVSRYHFAKNGAKAGTSFKDFVQTIHSENTGKGEPSFRRQVDFIFDQEARSLVNFIGRFENLSEDFARVCEALGLGRQQLPHVNAAPERRPYQEYYDAETKSLVDSMFQADIEQFAYSFE